MTIRIKLLTGFLFLILIFVLSFFVNQRLSTEVLKNSEYINRSETVIRNSNLIHKQMIDMQNGYRGYLLTSQADFLAPYHEGLKSVPTLIKIQQELVSTETQRLRLDSIVHYHTEWVAYANTLIKTKEDTLKGASEKYKELFEKKVKTGTGKKLNDEIRKLFQSFDNYEYQVRQERRLNLQESIVSTRRINLSLTLISITLALIASFLIVRIITRRISKMVKIAQDISQGNFTTIEDNKQDELTKLSDSLSTMSKILDKNFQDLTLKNNELDQFAYVVSHDLKAPLRGIDNITTWIEEDHSNDLTPEIKRNLDLIKGRARRLENLINGLLEYARIGKVKKELEQVDVGALLREVCDLIVPPDFEVKISGRMPVIKTVRVHLEQVFSNLISNAVKYNDKTKGLVKIDCRTLKDHYEFTVSDNGIGIQSQYFEKIFTIFQTLKERDAFESTGVGLAIVKRIIDNKRATIVVESEPGEGTLFRFTWPMTDPHSINS